MNDSRNDTRSRRLVNRTIVRDQENSRSRPRSRSGGSFGGLPKSPCPAQWRVETTQRCAIEMSVGYPNEATLESVQWSPWGAHGSRQLVENRTRPVLVIYARAILSRTSRHQGLGCNTVRAAQRIDHPSPQNPEQQRRGNAGSFGTSCQPAW